MQNPLPTETQAFQHDNIKAISWILLSVLVTSIMTISVRLVSFELHPSMIVFLRFGITTLCLVAAILAAPRLRATLTFSRPGIHLLRGICMGVASILGFYAIAHMELVTVTVIFFMVPIFATILAMLINGEKAGPRRLAAVAVSFLGVLLVLRPGYEPITIATIAAVLSSLLISFAFVLSRRVVLADGPLSGILSSAVITTLVSLPVAIPVWKLPDTATLWAIVLVLVITGSLRLLADIQAYRFGEASALAPFTYLRLIFIGAAAYFMFNELPDTWALLGSAIIIAAALYIAHREAMLKKQSSIAASQ